MRLTKKMPASWLATPFLLLFFLLALSSMVADSPTMDEQNHLTRGLTFLASGDPHFSLEHPPLINTLSALPVYALLDVKLPFDHPSWGWPRDGWYAFAEQVLWVANHDAQRMIVLARLPIIFLTMGLALAGAHFARALWGGGRVPAFVAAFLLLFDPNVMAHGRYTTTDLGGTALLLLATFLLWRAWQPERWLWGRWLAAAVGLGLAFSSKLSTLSFGPIFILLALLPLYGRRWRWPDAARRLAQLALAGVVVLFVVWALFAFEWRPFFFESERLLPLNRFSGPMPTFWAGIERILSISGGGRASYLLGRFSDSGFAAYFPVAFLAKTPLPVLIMLPVSLVVLLRQPASRGKALFLFLPAALYFLLASRSRLNLGYRHLLPVLPFLYLLIAGLAAHLEGARRPWRLAYPALLASFLASTLLIHPHYLSYFNAAAGGPKNGWRVLIDSNIDWGQDLIRLKRWMEANQVAEINLSWFGSADPAAYGIRYRPLPGLPRHINLWWELPFDPAQPAPGLYAISVSNLGELPLKTEEKVVFAYFRAREPDDRIGYSINIYRVP